MENKEREDWINTKWRPAMGWMYLTVCVTDFIIFPVLQPLFQAAIGIPVSPWKPLTLEGSGLFHAAMGAIVGVTAWSRGREKIAGVAGESSFPNSYSPPAPARNAERRIEPKIDRPSQPIEPEL